MMFMGSIVNGLTIIGGGLLGLILHSISDHAKDTVTKSLGLGTFALGIQMALQTKSFIVMVISLCLGGLIGEWLHIEDGMNHLGLMLEQRFARGNQHFAEGFVTATLIAVIGAMGILGAIQAGVSGDNTTLYTKSVMDGFMAIMLTASLGVGVIFSALPVIIYQGTITLFASFLVQFVPKALMTNALREIGAVGGAVLSLAFGPEVFAAFLEGAAAEDKLSANKDVLQNPEMLDALIGVYERNVLGYPSTAVLPYSQALNRFPAHLQQVDMESNGKSVNRFGEPVNYPTGPVLFGEPGTNGQHSFYQLLHQGTDIVPLQFVGFRNNQMETDVDIQGSTSQQKLCANVAAQIVAFACGKADENKNKNFEGGRPSSIIIGDQVNPKTLGALLAHFENKIMFQGFLWNVNSFDQEGVQLGKVLAKRVLAHETDGALKVFSDLLNI